MNFLHPWALAIGAAAVSLPVLIHWLTKPRPMRMPLSTVRFVRQILQHKRAAYRLRDWLILATRTAAVILLAWAFSRPLMGARPLIASDESGDAMRVVVLDVSQSTGAIAGGAPLLERGRSTAANYLKTQSGLRAALILAAAKPATVFEQASSNLGALRDALATAQTRPQRLDVQAAINEAAKFLATAGKDQRLELVVISDFQRSNWSVADFSPLPKDTRIQFESIAPAQPLQNVAILRVAASGRLQQGREAKLEVDVGNFSKSPRNVKVQVTVGETPYTVEGLCPPGVKTTLTTPVQLSSAGWTAGKATLVGMADALPADDSRDFVLGIRAAPVYALITRESAKPSPVSSHFLERAIVPAKAKEGVAAERVVRLDPSRLDAETLSSAAMLVIDHPGKLPTESINTLAGLMRRGRGVLYVAAEAIDATNLKLLADVAGADLKLPVDFLPQPGNIERRDLFLVDFKRDLSPFAGLGEAAGSLLQPLRFGGGLASRQRDGGLADDVLATYSDRSAALVVTSCGAGTLAVLNADLSRSSLTGSSAFVPLMSELIGRLLATRANTDAAACGETIGAYLPPEAGVATGLSVTSNKPGDTGGFVDSSGGVMWRWPDAGDPGVYLVKRGETTVYALATAAPASESDLATIDPSVVQTRLAGGYSVAFQSASGQPAKDTTWAWVLAACAACMIVELGLLKVFKT